MKIEINSENKARFFALYLGNTVTHNLTKQDFKSLGIIESEVVINDKDCGVYSVSNFKINLKPLSSISDEDAIEVGKMTGCWSRREVEECGDEIKDSLKEFGILFCGGVGKEWGLGLSSPFAGTLQDIIDATDYLRSRSYLLPWMGLSCEEIIEAGWAKYETI